MYRQMPQKISLHKTKNAATTITQKDTVMNETDQTKLPTILTAYGPHLRVPLECNDESRTKQSFADETNINNIMARFVATGLVDFVNEHSAHYGDVTGWQFHDAMNIVARSQEMFEALPASIRAKFQNDPATFLDFVDNPENDPEAIALGLKQAPETVATPLAPAAAASISDDPATAVRGKKAPAASKGAETDS